MNHLFSATELLELLDTPHIFSSISKSWSVTEFKKGEYVLTIVGQHLNRYIVESLLQELPGQTESMVTLHSLSSESELDAVVVQLDTAVTHEWLSLQSERFHIDVFCQAHQPSLRAGGVMVMDMDSTVIQIECIDEIAKLAGRGDEVSEVTELAMQGKLDFAQSLIQRVACLKGVPATQLQQIRDSIPLMPGISPLINTLQAHGWHIAIASGGFTYFADYVAARLGLVEAVANQLEIVDGVLTGKVLGDISDAQTKDDTLKRLARQFNVSMSQTIALGDGANDLVMMRDAGLGMAFHAKPLVQAQAQCAIRYHGLNSTLFALSA
jgi:phosphoserine phosphatase